MMLHGISPDPIIRDSSRILPLDKPSTVFTFPKPGGSSRPSISRRKVDVVKARTGKSALEQGLSNLRGKARGCLLISGCGRRNGERQMPLQRAFASSSHGPTVEHVRAQIEPVVHAGHDQVRLPGQNPLAIEGQINAIGRSAVDGKDSVAVFHESERSIEAQRMTRGALFAIRSANHDVARCRKCAAQHRQPPRTIAIVVGEKNQRPATRQVHALRSTEPSGKSNALENDWKHGDQEPSPESSATETSAPEETVGEDMPAGGCQCFLPQKRRIRSLALFFTRDLCHCSVRMQERGGSSGMIPERYPEATGATGEPEVEELPQEVRRELTQYVQEELARFGRAGEPRIVGKKILLRTPAATQQAELGPWASRWHLLDEPTRRLRCAQIARQLSPFQPSARPSKPPFSRRLSSLLPLIVLTALVCLGLWFFQTHRSPPSSRASSSPRETRQVPETPPPKPDAALANRQKRAKRVCATTRARVVRGATVTLADAEGWVVEYMAFKNAGGRSLAAHPALKRFFEDPSSPDGSRYIWTEEPNLALTPSSENRVTVSALSLKRPEGPRLSGVRITFEGTLVDSYFHEGSRAAYFHVAAALSNALDASHAGLFARCADGSTHHLGSWFAGTSHEQATTALVYMMGTYADPPHLAATHMSPLGESEMDRGLAFDSISQVTQAIDRPLLATLVGRQGGMVMGDQKHLTTVTFPFADGNRASRLSREIARLTKLAD